MWLCFLSTHKNLVHRAGKAFTFQKCTAGTTASTTGNTFSVMPTICFLCRRKLQQEGITPGDLRCHPWLAGVMPCCQGFLLYIKPCLFFRSVFADMLTKCKIHAGISQNEMPAEWAFHFLKHPQSFFSHDTQGVTMCHEWPLEIQNLVAH